MEFGLMDCQALVAPCIRILMDVMNARSGKTKTIDLDRMMIVNCQNTQGYQEILGH